MAVPAFLAQAPLDHVLLPKVDVDAAGVDGGDAPCQAHGEETGGIACACACGGAEDGLLDDLVFDAESLLTHGADLVPILCLIEMLEAIPFLRERHFK